MAPQHPSSKFMPTMALLDTTQVEILNVLFEEKFNPVAQLMTWVRSAYTHAPSPTKIPIKHLSKRQSINDNGIERDCPLREAFAPYRLLPEKIHFLKTARVRPNMLTPSFLASVKEQLMATRCDVIPGDVVKLESPLRDMMTFSKYSRAPAFNMTPQT
jgi:hypothetical protein